MSQGEFYFIYTDTFRAVCEVFYDCITQQKLWTFFRENDFYCFSIPIKYHSILIRLREYVHSKIVIDVPTYEYVMRSMENIAKYGLAEWKFDYIRLYRKDMVCAANTINRCVLDFIYNPSFKHCRERLKKEFLLLNKETDEILNDIHGVRQDRYDCSQKLTFLR